MKILFFAVILLAAVFAVSGPAQSVTITPKKVTYTRQKPLSDYKKTFIVRFPKVKASTPAISKKIESTISYSKVLGLNINEEIRDIQWLEEADYDVNYNSRGLLVITLQMNGSGAYPDGTSKAVVVDLKTGNRVRVADVFTNLSGLTAMVKKSRKSEIAKAEKEIKEDPANGDIDPAALFDGKNFTVKDLDEFEVSRTGATFIYDYGFPHVVQALEPGGRYSYTWTQLKPYIKRGSLLAKFVR